MGFQTPARVARSAAFEPPSRGAVNAAGRTTSDNSRRRATGLLCDAKTILAGAFALLLFVVPFSADAAINREDAVYTEAGGDSLTVGDASDIILCAAWVGADQLTGIAYNGDAFTQLDEQVVTGNERVEVWHLGTPDVGTNTITRSMSGGASIQIRCQVYSGAAADLPTGTAIAKTAAAASSVTVNPVSIADASWSFAAVRSTTTNISDGAGCDTPLSGLTDDAIAACDSNASLGTLGTETVTANGGGTMGIVAAVFPPFGWDAGEDAASGTETTSGTNTAVYQAELQNFIHGWAVILGAFALAIVFGWKLWRG